MNETNKIKISSIAQFMDEAMKRNYMTISKDYGLLARGRDGQLKGKLLTAGPKGNLDPKDYEGWIENEEVGE